jgi:outer membrane protein assembly factor BamA
MSPRGVPILLIAFAACGGGRGVVHHPGERHVAAVHVRGNHAVDDDTLVDGLALDRARHEGRALDPYELTQDADRIRGVYQRLGYFDVEVHPDVTRDGDATTVVFAVVEGPRAHLARVEIIGLPDDPELPAARVRALIATPDGAPFDYAAYDAAKPALVALLQDAGYARARLDGSVIADRVHHEAVVRLVFDAGPRCTFGPITLVGVDGGLAAAVRTRLAIHQGARFSNAALTRTVSALYDLRRFSTVQVDADRDRADAIVPVKVTVTVAARHEIRAGVGAGVDPLTYLVRPDLGYSVAGWPSPLTTFDADLQPAIATPHDFGSAELRIQALASLTRLDLFRPRVTGELAVAAQYLTVEAYTSVGPRLRLGLTSPLGVPQVRAHLGWQLWVLGFVNINPIVDGATRADLGLDHLERVSALDQSVVADFRDQPLEPHRGIYAALRVVEAATQLGSGHAYLQVEPDLRGYLSLGPVVLAAHARAGVFVGDVPATERYFSGGASSQRGFPERQLSPTASRVVDGQTASVVIGGAAMLETGLEVRATLTHLHHWPVEAALFLDGGDVTTTASGLDPLHLHWAAGTGLRLVTPYGPLRVDFGYRLDRYGPGEPLPGDRFAYQIGFGEPF